MISYARLVAEIRKVPKTWLPGLLAEIAGECGRHDVFVSLEDVGDFAKRAADAAALENKGRRKHADP